MNLFKNKASGKYFIHIEDVGNDEALFITPLGDLKFLELNLFSSQESVDEDLYLRRDIVTRLQVERYHKYMESIEV
jgi:hypothetical protein